MPSRIHRSLEHLEQQLQALRSEYETLRGIAAALPDGDRKAEAEELARKKKQKIAELEAAVTRPDGIRTLYPPVSEEEVLEARKKEAIRLGDDFFLPVWNNDEVGLPFAFIRSSMFPATNETPEGIPDDRTHPLKVWSKTVGLALGGTTLGSFDRLTFAACLMHYRDEPLAAEDHGAWIHTNLSRLMRLVKLSPGTSSRRRLLDSLARLNRASVFVAHSSRKISIVPLVEVDFPHQGNDGGRQLSIRIRIRETVALLYRINSWWRFPLSVVGEPGLTGWAGCYFLSHKYAEYVSLDKLKELSGTTSPPSSFRHYLTKALNKLQSGTEEVPGVVRDFAFAASDTGEETVRVTLPPKEKKKTPPRPAGRET